MEQWEKNYYISSIAGAVNGSSLVVMSKGLTITPFYNIYSCMTYSAPSFKFSMPLLYTIYYSERALLDCCTLPFYLSLSPLLSPLAPMLDL